MIKKTVKRSYEKRPTTAVIHAVDGDRADILVGPSSSNLLRHIQIVGDPSKLVPGQTVTIQWVERAGSYGLVPVVMTDAGGSDVATITNITAVADEVTITNTSDGLSVKKIGIGHLDFVPALAGHTHQDSFQKAGWQVTPDGMIYNGDTYISPKGQISLGKAPDVVKLDSEHLTYRIWAGAIDPALAPFSVSKTGAIHATSGDIAGWELQPNQFQADNGQAILNASDHPFLGLGGAGAYGQNGIWLGKDADGIYKVYVGDPANDHLYWDGSHLFITGTYQGILDAAGTQADSFTINENRDVVISSLILAGYDGDSTFTWNGSEVTLDVPLTVEGAVHLQGTLIFDDVISATMSWDGAYIRFDKPILIQTSLSTRGLMPESPDVYDIGSPTLMWRKGYLSEMMATLFVENTVQAIGGSFVIPHSQGTFPTYVSFSSHDH